MDDTETITQLKSQADENEQYMAILESRIEKLDRKASVLERVIRSHEKLNRALAKAHDMLQSEQD